MPITLVAAIDLNRAIGHQNQLLCKLPSDMKHFIELTHEGICIMGRKTYESIGKPLSNRTNIVLTRDSTYDPHPAVYLYEDIDTVLHEYGNYGEGVANLFVLGGASIYQQFLPYADVIELTIIRHKFLEADSFFPAISLDDFEVTSNIFNPADEENEYDHYFVTYQRKLHK